MKNRPTPWRASKAMDGTWRVIRTTCLGYATRVEVFAERCSSWDDADVIAQKQNTTGY